MILIRGAGDVGSAVAHVLYRAGHRVMLHDVPRPSHTRRGMAFTDALFDGTAELDGARAKRARSLGELHFMAHCGRAIPVSAEPLSDVLDLVRPQVLVDARMRKHDRPESQRGLAPLTIGLGPNFEAGRTADAAVETAWGDELGRVLWSGRTRDLEGEPQEIDGHARDRYVYAAVGGTFSTRLEVGAAVRRDQVIASIDGVEVRSPLSGVLRGLAHSGAEVRAGTKVVEIDPRGDPSFAFGLGARPARIAQGVLEAIGGASHGA